MISSPTAPNPNKLMAQLRMMPDQQLAQYAQMHKNDPYIFPMAFQESNTRKQMRAAQSAKAAPSQKVVDQNLQEMMPQQMMPEEQGIGALPAPNMQRMAGGGIVAFGGGGEVPGYAEGTLVGQGFRRDQMLPPPTSNRNALIANTMSDIATQSSQDELASIESQIRSMPPGPQRDYLENRKRILLSAPSASTSSATRTKMEAERNKNMSEVNRGDVNLRPTPANDPRIIGVTPPAETVQSLPKKPVVSSAAPRQGSGSTATKPAQEPTTGISSLATKPEDLQRIYGNMMPAAADPFETRIRELGELEKANAEKDLAQRKKDIQELGIAFTEREGKLKDRQGRIEKEEGRLPYAALMEAGLAMMSGTSPNAFANIGAGGATGMKSYQLGMNKISEAKDKLDDAFGRIEEARRGEKVLNAKELAALESNLRKTVTQTERDVLAGAQQAYGLANTQAGKMFDAYVTNKRSEFEQGEQTKRSMYEQDQQNKRTAMTVNAPSQLERILRDPVLSERYSDAQLGSSNLRRELALRKEYFDNPNFVTKYPTVESYLLANGVGGQGGASDGLKFLGSKPTQ